MAQKLYDLPTYVLRWRNNPHTGEREYIVTRGVLVIIKNWKDSFLPAQYGVALRDFQPDAVFAVFRKLYKGPANLRHWHYHRWLIKHGYIVNFPMDMRETLVTWP